MRSITPRLSASVAVMLAASEIAASANSTSRPRISAMLRIYATESLTAFLSVAGSWALPARSASLPPSGAGDGWLPPSGTGVAAPMFVPGAMAATWLA
jgi:hypothetical protein